MTSRDLQGYPATRGRIREQLAVVILTYNEELNLPACLESLEGLDCDLVVVDSASTDRTVAIARQHGAQVLSHPFESHVQQWHWSLQNVPSQAPWLFGLDADQRHPHGDAHDQRHVQREQARAHAQPPSTVATICPAMPGRFSSTRWLAWDW